MTREGIGVPAVGCWRRNTRVLTVATVGRGFPNTPVLARQHPGLVVINTRVLATSTPGCCDAKRGVLERHRYIVDFQGVFFFERTTYNGQQYIPHIYNMYIPDGFIPDVETCRGASPTPTRQYAPTYRRAAARLYHAAILRNIFHTANLLDEFISPTYI